MLLAITTIEPTAGTCSGTSDGFKCKECANIACSAGTFRTGTCARTENEYKCPACPTQQFSKAGANNSCTAKITAKDCPADAKFVAGRDAEKTKDDASCVRCKVGEFKDSVVSCAAKRSVCPAGQKFIAGDDDMFIKDDTQCVTCDPDTFKTDTSGATTCTPQTLCKAGQRILGDNKTAARACEACPLGT